jgi:GNAT superfamily N-acetyltransferase
MTHEETGMSIAIHLQLVSRFSPSRAHGTAVPMNPLKDLHSDSDVTFALRSDLRPGDLGVLISLHEAVYTRECGFDSTFEAHIARLLGEFIHGRTDRDGFWIAERERCLVGSIAVVGRSGRDAQLCWLLVEPSTRSMGLGRRLLHAAVEFCRRCEDDYVFLRSFRVLTAASHLFRSIDFDTRILIRHRRR